MLDLARALAGEVTEVHAFGARAARHELPDGDLDQVTVASLRFAGGAVGWVASACALTRSADQGHPVELDPLEVVGRG